MNMGVGLELAAPGGEAAGKAGQVGAEEALVFGKTFESGGGGLAQRRGGTVGRCAAQWSQGVGDRKGEEDVRNWELFFTLRVQPQLGWMMLPRRTVTGATGVLEAVVCATVLAVLPAMAIVAGFPVVDGADGLVLCEGQRGVALAVFWSVRGADLAQGGHEVGPYMRALLRAEVSSCPLWVRWRETRVVSRRVGPRER
jgi:hypothetical protein